MPTQVTVGLPLVSAMPLLESEPPFWIVTGLAELATPLNRELLYERGISLIVAADEMNGNANSNVATPRNLYCDFMPYSIYGL